MRRVERRKAKRLMSEQEKILTTTYKKTKEDKTMMPTIYSTRNQGWIPALFNDFFNDNWMPTVKYHGTTPAVNVSEDEKAYKVEIAAPGMTKEDFNVQLTTDGDIVISMEKKTENKEGGDKKTYLRREFSYSKFEQRFTLPDNVEKSKITAGMADGVLTIDIPKKTEEEKAKETLNIEIKYWSSERSKTCYNCQVATEFDRINKHLINIHSRGLASDSSDASPSCGCPVTTSFYTISYKSKTSASSLSLE